MSGTVTVYSRSRRLTRKILKWQIRKGLAGFTSLSLPKHNRAKSRQLIGIMELAGYELHYDPIADIKLWLKLKGVV